MGCLLLGVLATVPAAAAPATAIDLRWESPPGCPPESDVRNRIQKILGSGRHDSPLRAEGTISRIDGRFHLELVVHLGDVVGTRNLTSKSCDDLAGAAAVEIGLLVHSVEASGKPVAPDVAPAVPPAGGADTSRGSAEGASGGSSSGTNAGARGTNAGTRTDRAPEAPQGEPKVEATREADEQPPDTEPPRPRHILLQVPVGAIGIGPLPSAALGFGLGLGYQHEHWQLQLQGLYWRRQNVPVAGLPGYGADVDRVGASVLACHELRFSWLGLSPCLSAGLERVSAQGTGSNILPTSGHTFGMTAGAGAQGRVYLTPWLRLLASLAGEVELMRPQLVIQGLGPIAPPPDGDPRDPPTPVYQFAPAALTATLSLEWAL